MDDARDADPEIVLLVWPPRADVKVRMRLQRGAPGNLRRHALRALTRVLVLVAADFAGFWLLREVVRAVRDRDWLGPVLGSGLRDLMPQGSLEGWQLTVALGVSLIVLGNYGSGDRRRDPGRLLAAGALGTALTLWHAIWERGAPAVALEYAVLMLLVTLALITERLSVDVLVSAVKRRRNNAIRTLFVGPRDECQRIAAKPVFSAGEEYLSVGFVSSGLVRDRQSLGSLDEVASVISDHRIEAVVACGYLPDDRFQYLVDTALTAGCQLLSVPRAGDMRRVDPQLVRKNGVWFVSWTAPSLRGQQLLAKRAIDVVISAVGLLLLGPVIGVLALLVKLDSKGPAFFTQERVGRGGRRFNIIKLRTMAAGADGERDTLLSRSVYPDARLFKMKRDPRTTRVGTWLRRTSLDELPQLVNVLKGEMSLVGPRPPLLSEVDLYQEHHYARFDVKPGITGPWQVSGRNDITDFEDVVRLEVDYIRHWSLVSDLGILARTVPAVLQMRGAY